MTSKPKFLQEQRIAYHEAGYAVVSLFCSHALAIRKVTIIPTDEAHGHVAHYPESSFDSDADLATTRSVSNVVDYLPDQAASSIGGDRLGGRLKVDRPSGEK